MKRNVIRVLAFLTALCMLLASAAAETVYVQPNGVVSGDIAAKGKFYTDYSSLQEVYDAAQELNLRLAEEGQVLLWNENGALPLRPDENKVTLFGIASVDFVPGGGGSGSVVQVDFTEKYDWVRGLQSQGFKVNPKTISVYQKVIAAGGHTAQRYPEPSMALYTPSVTSTYRSYGDAAIVCFSRYGSENGDTATNNAEGHANPNDTYLQLQDNEKALIQHVKQSFSKVIVVLNSSYVMQIPELTAGKDSEYGVDAILWVGGVGQVGTVAAAEILTGAVNPSGKLPDTWPADLRKAPGFTNFSDMSQNFNEDGTRMDAYLYESSGNKTPFAVVEYREDIYMGYRFYETIAADMNAAEAGSGDAWLAENVTFPFGYGLSYTTFEWELAEEAETKAIDAANQQIAISVKVTNTGDKAGKDVVEIYAAAPYTNGGIEKAAANLVGFGKTRLLQPGESDVVTVTFVAQDMASFDWQDKNNNGFTGYELEKGDYVISARRDAHNVALTETYTIGEDILCETDYTTGREIKPLFVDDFTTVRDEMVEHLATRADGALAQPAAATRLDRTLEDWEASVLYAEEIYRPYNDEPGQPWYVEAVPETWDQEQPTTVTLGDLSGVLYNESKIVDGQVIPGEMDEGTRMWEEYMNSLSWEQMEAYVKGTMGVSGSDGPVQFGKERATSYVSNPICAATWNEKLLAEQGVMYGNEAIFLGISGWHGGGLDTHRNPFNGRNFEYYSEDGVLAGVLGAAVCRGVTSKGIMAYYKHFVCNDQEFYRANYGGVVTLVTEQALREIYLKPFEMVVKAGSLGLMTSFNRIGYVVNSDNWAVHEDLLRGEWDFNGATITDAWAKAYVSLDLMVRAGDDFVLGGSDSFTDAYFSPAVWSREDKGVLVAADEDEFAAGTQSVLSPTHYYAVRRSAQRCIFNQVNSNKMKNNLENVQMTATLLYGAPNTAVAQTDETQDFSITPLEELPAGLAINGSVISYAAVDGEYLPVGEYIIPIQIQCDTWVNTTGTLRLIVAIPIDFNGETTLGGDTAEDPLAVLKAGEAYEGVFTPSSLYNYHNMIVENRNFYCVSSWYEAAAHGGPYIRSEDVTAADLLCYPAEDAETAHEQHFTYTGDLPEGMELAEVENLVTGFGGGQYNVVTEYKLTGTPTAPGAYTFTIRMEIPYATKMWGAYLVARSTGVWVLERTVTLVVE